MKITQQNVAWVSAALYTGGSLLAALVFFIAALIGDYGWVARIGGSLWVFGLAMIILMPTVMPFLRDRARS
jgi:hypothetical protein